MAVIQSKLNEVRYLKRKNLKQESRMISNMYRDLIRSYGIDCIYYKLDTSKLLEFKNIIDENAIIRTAYGFNENPDYSISANMITFMEVQSDIFQLSKYGINPNMEVNFFFDSESFACSLATKLGKYKEYKVEEKEICLEVPEYNEKNINAFPYHLGAGYSEIVTCDLLSGKVDALIENYEFDKEYTIPCRFREHTDFKVEFPVNKFIHKSFKYKINSDDYIDQALFLTFKVSKIYTTKKKYKCILTGKINGAILFYDLQKIDKNKSLIHPEVGDIITIDFPDENNREQYEITEAINKQLTQDGLNPLLHSYIWKCTARRYVNSHEEMETNEGNDILDERTKYEDAINQSVIDKILITDEESNDAVYGGYEKQDITYDKNIIGSKTDKKKHEMEYLDPYTAIDILRFECGSKLATDGYNLYFVNKNEETVMIGSENLDKQKYSAKLFEQDLEHLKANDSTLVFMDINGTAHFIIHDRSPEEKLAQTEYIELCLNSLLDKTYQDHNINKDLDNFYKFNNTKTFLFATPEHLFCKLHATGKMYQLA